MTYFIQHYFHTGHLSIEMGHILYLFNPVHYILIHFNCIVNFILRKTLLEIFSMRLKPNHQKPFSRGCHIYQSISLSEALPPHSSDMVKLTMLRARYIYIVVQATQHCLFVSYGTKHPSLGQSDQPIHLNVLQTQTSAH